MTIESDCIYFYKDLSFMFESSVIVYAHSVIYDACVYQNTATFLFWRSCKNKV